VCTPDAPPRRGDQPAADSGRDGRGSEVLTKRLKAMHV
jgi:hypothetical protein